MDIKEHIAADLLVPENLIRQALAIARVQVKRFEIPKRSGGKRYIYQPSKKLKTLQYWIIAKILSELPLHEAAIAYREGMSILHNAKRHRNNRFFLKVDLKDFFPSINWVDFLPILRSWHNAATVDWPLNAEAEDLIRLSCFYTNDALPIGYPSSPAISNAVMYSVDVAILQIVSDTEKYGNCVYTRYADDLMVSTDRKGACKTILSELKSLVRKTKSPNICINHRKTKMASSTGGSVSVTGLKVCADGHITLHRKHKDHIRLLMSLFRKGQLDASEFPSLLGHIAYAHYNAPAFYTKLQEKYFREIAELRATNL